MIKELKDKILNELEIEIRNCESKEEMYVVLKDLFESGIDLSDPEINDALFEYRAQIEDMKNDALNEIDSVCNRWIEEGMCKLYMCTKDIMSCRYGNRYYIRIDDVSNEYLKNIEEIRDLLDAETIDKLSNIKPLIYIISDSGTGTLKRHDLFMGELCELENWFNKIN